MYAHDLSSLAALLVSLLMQQGRPALERCSEESDTSDMLDLIRAGADLEPDSQRINGWFTSPNWI